jgi:FkbM family methyltransferase
VVAYDDDPQWEPELTAAIEGLVHEGWTCVDVGAHHGNITATLVRLAGNDGRVVAFEAHPANAEQLRGRFRDAGVVEIVNAAVSDGESETLTLYAGRNDWNTEWNIVGHDVDGVPTRGVLEVQSVSLDKWFQPGEPVNFVKIDVEGAEGFVLAGMRRLLREQRPALAVEFHNDEGWASRRELLEAGYTLLGTDGSPVDADGPRVYHVVAVPAGG